MVLQKVGEFQTTVNVNGEEKVSTLQSSDKTYNLSESFTTDIKVNGTTRDTYTQTNNSTYNISTSNTATISTGASLDDGQSTTLFNTASSIPIVKVDWSVTDKYGLGSGGYSAITSDDGNIGYVSSFSEPQTETGVDNNPSYSRIGFEVDEDSGSGECSVTITVDISELNVGTSVSQL